MHRRPDRVLTPAAAALVAATGWISLGTTAVVESTSMRVAALPPLWLLGSVAAVAAAAAWWRRWRLCQLSPCLPLVALWLPFVPGRVPAAFLIWQGPAEAIVWGLVGLGYVWRARASRPSAEVERWPFAPWGVAALTLILSAAGSWALSPRLPGGDEPHYLVIAQSLWYDGDVAVDDNHARRDYVPFTANSLEPHYVRRGLDGRIYSVHAPGLSAVVLPAFLASGVGGARAVVLLMTALAAAFTWSTARLLTGSAAAASAGWAAVFLTAPLFMQSFTITPDAPATLGVAAGCWLLTRLDRRRAPGVPALVAVSLLLALLPWLHSRFALIAGPLGLAIAWRLWTWQGWRPVAVFVVIPTLVAAGWFAFFWVIWGTPSPNAPWGDFARPSAAKVLPGLIGLLLDQQVGLLAHAPVYAAALPGAVSLLFLRRRLGIEYLAAAVPYALVVSAYDGWPGGFGGPSRYLVTVLPVGGLAIAWLWGHRGVCVRAVTGVGLALSIMMLVGRLTLDGGASAFVEGYGHERLFTRWSPAVDALRALPDLRTPDGIVVAGLWVLAGLGTGALVLRAARVQSPAAAWTAASMTAVVTPLVAATLAWTSDPVKAMGVSPASSQVAFLGGWPAAWTAVLVQWRAPFVVPPATLVRRLDIPLERHRVAGSTSFSIADVPAGAYEIAPAGGRPVSGAVAVVVGDSGGVLDRWEVDGARPAPHSLVLPVGVRSLTLTGDARAVDALAGVHLRVVSPPSAASPQRALHGVALASWRAFFLDAGAYVERTGFWTIGEAATSVLFERATRESGPLRLRIDSGAVPTEVDITASSGARPWRLSLSPRERRVVDVPAGADGRVQLTIATSAAFLPVQHDPGNGDHRHLGVWIEPQ